MRDIVADEISGEFLPANEGDDCDYGKDDYYRDDDVDVCLIRHWGWCAVLFLSI